MVRLSVITPTYNKLHLLRRTLDSLSKQSFPASDFEVLVIDDGSTDGTREYLENCSTPFALRTLPQGENRGRAAARNRGIEDASGELVVFLDDDMELVEGFLEAHWDFHQGRSKVAGIGNVINHPEVTEAPIDRYMSTRGAQKIKDQGRLPWRYFSTNNASVRREDLQAIGGFDEQFRFYGFEDLELAYRLEKERGVQLWFVTGARSLHIHPHTLQEVLEKKTLVGRSSMPYLFSKHPETVAEMGFDKYLPPPGNDQIAAEPCGLCLS